MRTYLLDILNRYNRFSENLDVKTILCNKSWLIFNDTGDKELYIFQENGSLIVSINGKVTNGTWQYISTNKSIILSFKGQAYMLHPSFFDKTIFALQQDGTNRYAFMIDEQQSQSFQPKSLTELSAYFKNIERKKVEAEQQRIRIALAQQKAQQKRIEEEQRQQEQYRIEQEKRQREREQEELINRAIEEQKKADEDRKIEKKKENEQKLAERRAERKEQMKKIQEDRRTIFAIGTDMKSITENVVAQAVGTAPSIGGSCDVKA